MRFQTITSIKRQEGFVVVLLLLIIVLGASSYLLSEIEFSDVELERERKTQQALAQAKQSLIASMILKADHTTLSRVGSITCYDRTGSVSGESDTPCTAPLQGKLPHKTLNIDDIRDGYGERLWFAFPEMLSRDDISGAPNINSDNLIDPVNQLTLDGEPMLAVIIAPGRPLNNLQRIGRPGNDITDYLEGENANSDAAFTRGVGVANFNDKIIGIKASDVKEAIERRVLVAVRDYLDAFYAVHNYYPYPDDDSVCNSTLPPTPPLPPLPSLLIGKIPTDYSDSSCDGADDEDTIISGSSVLGFLPQELTNIITNKNRWFDNIWYAVSPHCTLAEADDTIRCNTSGAASDYVYLDGVPQEYIVFMAKEPQAGLTGNNCYATVPGVLNEDQTLSAVTGICKYLEDYDAAETNSDGDNLFYSNTGANQQRNDIILGKKL